jgi:hypothetical protein
MLFLTAQVFLFPDTCRSASSLRALNHLVVDAEYSKALDKIITVSSTPSNQLHVIDPVSGEDRAVNLSYIPTCVSVGPDGIYAAVGHNGKLSYVDLNNLIVITTYEVSTDVFDVVLAGNGYAYAFPRSESLGRIRCINLQTRQETLHTSSYVYDNMSARLHPDGTSIYGAESSYYLRKFDISAGTAAYLYMLYSTDNPINGNLWISEDGLRIFAASGAVFRSSLSRSEDMIPNGKLFSGAVSLGHLAHSAAANKVASILKNVSYPAAVYDTSVWIHQYNPLEYSATISLPSFPSGSASYASHGRFIFFNSTGSRLFAIVQADAASGLLYDNGVATIDLDGGSKLSYTITASAAAGGSIKPERCGTGVCLWLSHFHHHRAAELPDGDSGRRLIRGNRVQLHFHLYVSDRDGEPHDRGYLRAQFSQCHRLGGDGGQHKSLRGDSGKLPPIAYVCHHP